MIDVAEKDWKVFRRLHSLALERHCAKTLRMAQDIAGDKAQTNHQRYQRLFGLMQDRDKEIARAFNNPRRSVVLEQIVAIRSLGLLEGSDLSKRVQQ
jgi:hypothetical protein